MVQPLLKFTHDTNDFTAAIILKNQDQMIFKVHSKINNKQYYANSFTIISIPDTIQYIINSGLINDLKDFYIALLSIKNTFYFNEELSVLEVTLSFCHKTSVMEIPVYLNHQIQGQASFINSQPDNLGQIPEELDQVKNQYNKNHGLKYYAKIDNQQGHYEGQMLNNLMHGKGKFFFKNGDLYTGQFFEGQRNGYGELLYEDGEKYEGNFISNYMYGKGKYYIKDGTLCESFFKLSLANGPGIQTSPEGNVTYGWYVDGLIQGNLVSFYNNGDIFEQPTQGFAKYYYKNGQIFEGYYKDGLKDGFGTTYWADNVKQEGNYVKDQRHGEFRMIQADGAVESTYWFQGVNCSEQEFKKKISEESAGPASAAIQQLVEQQDTDQSQNPCPSGP